MRYTFLYAQLKQVTGGASPTFEMCGFELTKAEKDALLVRWAREYPELTEAVLIAREILASGGSGGGSGSGAGGSGAARPSSSSVAPPPAPATAAPAASGSSQIQLPAAPSSSQLQLPAAPGNSQLQLPAAPGSSQLQLPAALGSSQPQLPAAPGSSSASPAAAASAALSAAAASASRRIADAAVSVSGGGLDEVAAAAARTAGFRPAVWRQLGRAERTPPVPPIPAEIPPDLADTFRLDPFGNVVAVDAEPNCLCAFEVEHLFPRRRGGRTVLQNLAAVHWYSVRIRGGRLLAAVATRPEGRNPLSSGLTDSMLGELWAARARMPPVLQGTSAFRSVLSALLLTNWHKGDAKDMFNSRTGLLHATPPDQLFDALLSQFHAAATPYVVGWHLGLLVGLPRDPTGPGGAPIGSVSAARPVKGWADVPPRTTLYKTFNQVLELSKHLGITALSDLPAVGVDGVEGEPQPLPESPTHHADGGSGSGGALQLRKSTLQRSGRKRMASSDTVASAATQTGGSLSNTGAWELLDWGSLCSTTAGGGDRLGE
ncbi:hypothetical protein FOA52_007295 [Chlamydomonas sp. UWO 241]|nr:hypothetical protein FOA52_007295 [Chlamydomonas sp. UWO 241]